MAHGVVSDSFSISETAVRFIVKRAGILAEKTIIGRKVSR